MILVEVLRGGGVLIVVWGETILQGVEHRLSLTGPVQGVFIVEDVK